MVASGGGRSGGDTVGGVVVAPVVDVGDELMKEEGTEKEPACMNIRVGGRGRERGGAEVLQKSKSASQ